MSDILVKSRLDADLVPDLEETFTTLRQYNIKLNLKKCVFGVSSEKFLGYIVTEKGIETNLEKVQALCDMLSPGTLNEVQRLVGRIMALSRFIS